MIPIAEFIRVSETCPCELRVITRGHEMLQEHSRASIFLPHGSRGCCVSLAACSPLLNQKTIPPQHEQVSFFQAATPA